MDIELFLDRKDVIYDVPVGTKEEVISFLVDVMANNHPELERTLLLQSLLNRERLQSTGIDNGVAIPHGKVSGFSKLLACFGICRDGVDFDSFNGSSTHFFFVLLIPENMQGTHLKVLARLSRMFEDCAYRVRMMNAIDSEALYEAIVQAYRGKRPR
jgi:PTS system nitrogen regulatory IIA component